MQINKTERHKIILKAAKEEFLEKGFEAADKIIMLKDGTASEIHK